MVDFQQALTLLNNTNQFPLDALTLTLKDKIQQYLFRNENIDEIRVVGSNLFLFNNEQWKIIGEILKKLHCKVLKFDSCNHNIDKMRIDLGKVTDWGAFFTMLKNTYVTYLDLNVVNKQYLEPGTQLKAAAICKMNALKEICDSHPGLSVEEVDAMVSHKKVGRFFALGEQLKLRNANLYRRVAFGCLFETATSLLPLSREQKENVYDGINKKIYGPNTKYKPGLV